MTWEAGWRYGIMSTVPYEQQKIYRQIILFQRIYYFSISLTGLPCHREPSIVLMSMSDVRQQGEIEWDWRVKGQPNSWNLNRLKLTKAIKKIQGLGYL